VSHCRIHHTPWTIVTYPDVECSYGRGGGRQGRGHYLGWATRLQTGGGGGGGDGEGVYGVDGEAPGHLAGLVARRSIFAEVPAVPTSFVAPRGRVRWAFAVSYTEVAGWQCNLAREPPRAGHWSNRVRRVYKKEGQKRTKPGSSMKVDQNRLLGSNV